MHCILTFHILRISSRKNMGPNELKDLTFSEQVTRVSIFSIQRFFKGILLVH